MSFSRVWLTVAAGRGLFMVLYAIPIAYLIASSLKSAKELVGHPSSLLFAPDLAAYRQVWNDQLVSSGISSLEIALGTTILVLVLGAPAAYALAHHRHGLATIGLGGLILLQMIPQATTIIPLFKVLGGWGLLGSIQSVILANTALLLPFAIMMLRPFFLAVPREVEEAGRVDGASGIRSFIAISLPLARNGVITVGVLLFMITWGEFLYAITLLTDSGSYPLAGLMSLQVTQYGIVWNRLFAVAVLSSLPLIILFAAMHRRLTEGLSLGVGK
jgi:multiple sugar transport system permease protein